jgi:hypothetical protein
VEIRPIHEIVVGFDHDMREQIGLLLGKAFEQSAANLRNCGHGFLDDCVRLGWATHRLADGQGECTKVSNLRQATEKVITEHADPQGIPSRIMGPAPA